MRRIFVSLLIIVLSMLASAVGLGLSYPNSGTANGTVVGAKGIYNDSWLVDGAELSLGSLAPRGNQLVLKFSDWHPGDQPTPHVKLSVCDELVADVQLAPGQKTQRIFLTNACNPKIVHFEVLNPFHGSESDTRMLGAQLESYQVTSKLGFPIVSIQLIAIVGIAIALVTGLLSWSLSGVSGLLLGVFIPLASGAIVASTRNLDLSLVMWLWLVMMCIALGLFVGRRVGGYAESTGERAPLWVSFGIIGIVALGAAVRFYHLDFGLPFNFHPDEVPKFNAVMRMRAAGDLNPRYFLHPSFLLYSSYGMNVLLHWLGDFGTFEQTLTFAGRLVSATTGTLSIYLVYRIGQLLFSSVAGLYAALFLAVFPLHVTCSRYVKEDALLTFFLLLSAWAFCHAVINQKKWALYLAGLFAGFAASTKYSGMLCVAYLAIAPWLVGQRPLQFKKEWVLPALIAILLVPVGFVVLTPYSVLDAATFA
ncbi:MAG: glycosyltransferase family 39 protein, partial [Bdellovibrionales bacterium]|nr:glycosyltransferase family 39 protein [Bdellovibrionales bacterium]